MSHLSQMFLTCSTLNILFIFYSYYIKHNGFDETRPLKNKMFYKLISIGLITFNLLVFLYAISSYITQERSSHKPLNEELSTEQHYLIEKQSEHNNSFLAQNPCSLQNENIIEGEVSFLKDKLKDDFIAYFYKHKVFVKKNDEWLSFNREMPLKNACLVENRNLKQVEFSERDLDDYPKNEYLIKKVSVSKKEDIIDEDVKSSHH